MEDTVDLQTFSITCRYKINLCSSFDTREWFQVMGQSYIIMQNIQQNS